MRKSGSCVPSNRRRISDPAHADLDLSIQGFVFVVPRVPTRDARRTLEVSVALDEVAVARLEPDGRITVVLKPEARSVRRKDLDAASG